mmetsp:Transcript_15237/g.20120  ORF Transcript_15237/g.20120 Transcript_15237/m.20120 type:complete len:89 (-) Transcript_15237:205-471(-)
MMKTYTWKFLLTIRPSKTLLRRNNVYLHMFQIYGKSHRNKELMMDFLIMMILTNEFSVSSNFLNSSLYNKRYKKRYRSFPIEQDPEVT